MRFRVIPTRSRVNRFLAMLVGAAVLILATPMGHASNTTSALWTSTYGSISSSLENADCALCHDQDGPTKNDPIINNFYGVALKDEIADGFTVLQAFRSHPRITSRFTVEDSQKVSPRFVEG